jgi:hypothetical protein
MKIRTAASAMSIAVMLLVCVVGTSRGNNHFTLENKRCVISTPLIHRTPSIHGENRSKAEGKIRGTERIERRVYTTSGENLSAVYLNLSNNYEGKDDINVVGGVNNNGSTEQHDVVLQFWLGHPDDGGTQIGSDIVIPSLAPGSTAYDSTIWHGFTGSEYMYFIVDPYNAIEEEDETDNIDSFFVSMRDSVPWVWQEVDGYCHYASLAMMFNCYGSNDTVYGTVELANCPHSMIYIDDWFYIIGGIFVSQAMSDLAFAGEIRNCSMDLDIEYTWNNYVTELKSHIDSGLPAETSVDPYYMPQEDYDLLRAYDIHGGHGIVIIGYTDSSVIVNDPGVGLPFPDNPPIPDPEKRGIDVIIDLETFRSAVESTSGTPYLLLSYTPNGGLPSHDEVLCRALEQSIPRLEGNPEAFDPGWFVGWPPGWDPLCSIPGYTAMREDMNLDTFQPYFYWVLDQAGDSLELALEIIEGLFNAGMCCCEIGWDASEVYYGTLSYPEASHLSDLSARLSPLAADICSTYSDMVDEIRSAGGDPGVAEPYLTHVGLYLDEVISLENSVLFYLEELYDRLTGVEERETSPPSHAVKTELSCYPNPFGDEMSITWRQRALSIPTSCITLKIYDLSGRLINTLSVAEQHSPYKRITWNGKDRFGKDVRSGIYFVGTDGYDPVKVVKMQ